MRRNIEMANQNKREEKRKKQQFAHDIFIACFFLSIPLAAVFDSSKADSVRGNRKKRRINITY